MMRSLMFMVNEKMCCGTHIDKRYEDSLITLRVGAENYQKEILKEECLPMDFTGRPMEGYTVITSDGHDMGEDLTYWIKLGLS